MGYEAGLAALEMARLSRELARKLAPELAQAPARKEGAARVAVAKPPKRR
jgi:hypothetical protein